MTRLLTHAGERTRAAAARARAGTLRLQARELRRQAEAETLRLMNDLRRTDGPSLGEHGDSFSLRLGRLLPAVGLARHDLSHWLERRGVGADETHDIALACSEACANAVEHPRAVERHAFIVSATRRRGEVELAVRDFGRWTKPGAKQEDEDRGRGLQMIEALMDDVRVAKGRRGSRVTMWRKLTGEDGRL